MIIKVPFDFDLGIPIIPDEIKERVRQGEQIDIEILPQTSGFVQNALRWGVAGINVDGCRVAGNVPQTVQGASSRIYGGGDGLCPDGHQMSQPHNGGRWPANLVLSHSPGCRQVGVRKVKGTHEITRGANRQQAFGMGRQENVQGYADPDGTETIPAWECVEGCAVRMLDAQSGERNGSHPQTPTHSSNAAFGGGRYDNSSCYADTGGASRFFYCAKASRSEREAGLLGHIPCIKCGGLDTVTHIDPKTGKEVKCVRNGHPTVKPLDFMRWLCRLTATPTGGVVLDPFMGSGPTGIAAVLENRDFIGIELERESFEVAKQRIAHAEAQLPEAVQPVLL